LPTNSSHLRPPNISIPDFLNFYAEWKKARSETVFCFQVGANDGKINDPLNAHLSLGDWSGLLVEPQVDVFNRDLTATYAGNTRITLANVAIGPVEGASPFYRVAISDKRWATGLSGFRRENILAHMANGYIQRKARADGIALPQCLSDMIETITVPTVTIDNLLSRHGVEHFDVLCIDTEGFDFEILKLVDFGRYRPEVAIFESRHLSDRDYLAAKKMLFDHGYRLYRDGGDTLATLVNVPGSIRSIGRILERAVLRLRGAR
jgi:FkbM family methyltransferase